MYHQGIETILRTTGPSCSSALNCTTKELKHFEKLELSGLSSSELYHQGIETFDPNCIAVPPITLNCTTKELKLHWVTVSSKSAYLWIVPPRNWNWFTYTWGGSNRYSELYHQGIETNVSLRAYTNLGSLNCTTKELKLAVKSSFTRSWDLWIVPPRNWNSQLSSSSVRSMFSELYHQGIETATRATLLLNKKALNCTTKELKQVTYKAGYGTADTLNCTTKELKHLYSDRSWLHSFSELYHQGIETLDRISRMHQSFSLNCTTKELKRW